MDFKSNLGFMIYDLITVNKTKVNKQKKMENSLLSAQFEPEFILYFTVVYLMFVKACICIYIQNQ